MKITQKDFERKVTELCNEGNVDKVNEFVNNFSTNEKWDNNPEENFIKAIAKLEISSENKTDLVDRIVKFYSVKMYKYFNYVLSYSLEYGRDVGVSFIEKYGCRMDYVGRKPILVYLFELKRFDLLDAMIKKFSSIIRRTNFVMKYHYRNADEIIDYVNSKRVVPTKSDDNIKAVEIILCDASEVEFSIKDLTQIKINDLSVEEFVKTNEQYIENMIIKINNLSEDQVDLVMQLGLDRFVNDSICTMRIVLDDGVEKKYYLEWLGDDYYGYDFLQRYCQENNGFVWTYDNRYISSNYFSDPGFEEKIKHDNNLDYKHKITAADLMGIKKMKLNFDLDMLFNNVDRVVEDLVKIPSLESLELSFRCYYTSNTPQEFDVSSLKRLSTLKSILIDMGADEAILIGEESLCDAGLPIVYTGVFTLID